MILPGAISRPEDPIVVKRSSSPTTTYGSEGEFRRIVESFERNITEPQGTTRMTKQIIEEQRDERQQEQAEQLQKNRTNARFRQLGVRRNPFGFRTLANRMRREN
jgi:ribosomal protein L9